MAKGNTLAKTGVWAFILGVILALILGIFVPTGSATLTSILILLGIIVGFLNITDKETKDYLLAAVTLVIITSLGGAVLGNIEIIGPYIVGVFSAIMTFVIPATIIVALKTIYSIAQS